MRKFDLLRLDDSIIRILDIQGDRVFVLNCVRETMPTWTDAAVLSRYSACSTEDLSEANGIVPAPADTLDPAQRKAMHQRYTAIAPLLLCLSDTRERSQMVALAAEMHQTSKQTIRSYLCRYLAYLDITALAPQKRNTDRPLTPDEKSMRWALNRFFYSRNKASLATAYTMMLKEKYCDETGSLAEQYPSFYQFRYFYRKTRNWQNFYISRNGLTDYQRNNRPLTGEGVREFAPAAGVGLLDSTICDIYLINDAGDLVGWPILTACIDVYSGLCCGYALSWEGGLYSLRSLLLNVIADKAAWCGQFGISIQPKDWGCDKLPGTLLTDMGSEYRSKTFEQITELGVTLVNLPSYRPELKGQVEKFFDLIQSSYKKHLKGKGVIEPDFQERGAPDYRKDACLTMRDFEKVVLHCILYYNASRIVESFPYTEAMIEEKVKPHASDIWRWSVSQAGANLISVGARELVLTLLPRTEGKFCRNGLIVNKLRYHCEGFTEKYLSGGRVTVAYDPEDISSVWFVSGGVYTEFSLIESRFQGKDLSFVQALQSNQKAIKQEAVRANLQAQIDLAQHIQTIGENTKKFPDTRLKNVRSTRKKERYRNHQKHLGQEGTE